MALFDVLDGGGADGSSLLDEGLLGGELGEELALLPAGVLGDFTKDDELASGLETQDAERARHDNATSLLVLEGDAVEGLETVEGGLTTGGLAREHTPDGAPQDHARSGQVERTTTRVGARSLVLEVGKDELVPTQRAGDIQTLAADHSHGLTGEQLLGDHRRKTTKQMAATVNHDFLLEHL